LVVLGSIGEVRLRPPAGSLVLYSSGAVHRVQPVESGRREVVIGWVQSLIRDDRQREVVADLGWLLKDYLRRMGSDPHAELLLKCQQNLSRMWIDPQSQ
jgi:PKHD-type hydroxylase